MPRPSFRKKHQPSETKSENNNENTKEIIKPTLVILKVNNVALDNSEGVIPRIKNAKQLIPILRFLQQQNQAFRVALVSTSETKSSTDRSAVGMDLFELISEFNRYGITIDNEYVLAYSDVRPRQAALVQPLENAEAKKKEIGRELSTLETKYDELESQITTLYNQGDSESEKYAELYAEWVDVEAKQRTLKESQNQHSVTGRPVELDGKNVFYENILTTYVNQYPNNNNIEALKSQTVVIDDSNSTVEAAHNYGISHAIKAPAYDEDSLDYLTSFADTVGYSKLSSKEKEQYTVREHVELLELYRRLTLEKKPNKEKVNCLLEEIDSVELADRSDALNEFCLAIKNFSHTQSLSEEADDVIYSASSVYLKEKGIEKSKSDMASNWDLEQNLIPVLKYVQTYLQALQNPEQKIPEKEKKKMLSVLLALFNLDKIKPEDALEKLLDVTSRMIYKLENPEMDIPASVTSNVEPQPTRKRSKSKADKPSKSETDIEDVDIVASPPFFVVRASKEATGQSVVLAELLHYLFEREVIVSHGPQNILSIMGALVGKETAQSKIYTEYYAELYASKKGKGKTGARMAERGKTKAKAQEEYRQFATLLQEYVEAKDTPENQKAISQLRVLVIKINGLDLTSMDCTSIGDLIGDESNKPFSNGDLDQLKQLCQKIIAKKVVAEPNLITKERGRTIAEMPPADTTNSSQGQETPSSVTTRARSVSSPSVIPQDILDQDEKDSDDEENLKAEIAKVAKRTPPPVPTSPPPKPTEQSSPLKALPSGITVTPPPVPGSPPPGAITIKQSESNRRRSHTVGASLSADSQYRQLPSDEQLKQGSSSSYGYDIVPDIPDGGDGEISTQFGHGPEALRDYQSTALVSKKAAIDSPSKATSVKNPYGTIPANLSEPTTPPTKQQSPYRKLPTDFEGGSGRPRSASDVSNSGVGGISSAAQGPAKAPMKGFFKKLVKGKGLAPGKLPLPSKGAGRGFFKGAPPAKQPAAKSAVETDPSSQDSTDPGQGLSSANTFSGQ